MLLSHVRSLSHSSTRRQHLSLEALESRQLLSAAQDAPIASPLTSLGGAETVVNTETAGNQTKPLITLLDGVGYAINRISLDLQTKLDLNGLAAGVDFQQVVLHDGKSVQISDPQLLITAALMETMTGATISIEDAHEGDTLSFSNYGTHIFGRYADGVLTLTGSDSVENYRKVLASVKFSTTSVRPGGSSIAIQFTVRDENGVSSSATTTLSVWVPGSAQVASSQLVSVTSTDTIVMDKQPYYPGQGGATFDNITNFSGGINGLNILFEGEHGSPTLEDLSFKVGINNDPATWTDAPPPTEYEFNSQSASLRWDFGAIKNTWLQITVAANYRTGLATPAVFYFGSRVGDTGLGNPSAVAITNALDEIEVRKRTAGNVSAENPFDFNLDHMVNAADEIIARSNTGVLRMLNLPGNIIPGNTAPQAATPQVASEQESLAGHDWPLAPRLPLATRLEETRAAVLGSQRTPQLLSPDASPLLQAVAAALTDRQFLGGETPALQTAPIQSTPVASVQLTLAQPEPSRREPAMINQLAIDASLEAYHSEDTSDEAFTLDWDFGA